MTDEHHPDDVAPAMTGGESEGLSAAEIGAFIAPWTSSDFNAQEAGRKLAGLISARRASSSEPGREGAWRPEVRAFADLMEAQLRANDHKPGWKGEEPKPLWSRLSDEALELADEIEPGSRTDYAAWSARVGREAADVANFAMMIADVCGALSTPAAPASTPLPVGEALREALFRSEAYLEDREDGKPPTDDEEITIHAGHLRALLAALAPKTGAAQAGGEVGDYATFKRDGSFASEREALVAYKRACGLYTPPDAAGDRGGDAGLSADFSALANAFRWFRLYPEYKPNPDMAEKMSADIKAANDALERHGLTGFAARSAATASPAEVGQREVARAVQPLQRWALGKAAVTELEWLAALAKLDAQASEGEG